MRCDDRNRPFHLGSNADGFRVEADGQEYLGARLMIATGSSTVVPPIPGVRENLGSFVLTGGEIPAMAVADCVCRMVPGVLSEEVCFTEESHWNGLLEYPQYSRPDEWHGRRVPDVLLSGNPKLIREWQDEQAIERTKRLRPHLLKD